MKQGLTPIISILLILGSIHSTAFGSVPASGSEQIDSLLSVVDSIPTQQDKQQDHTATLSTGLPADRDLHLTASQETWKDRSTNKKVSKRRQYKPPYPELSADSIRTLKRQRGLTSLSNTFVPKGQWVIATNVSFSTHSNNNYTFVVIEGIDSEGHTMKITPALGYALTNNMVVGVRFAYSRTFLRIDNGSIQLGDDDTGVDLKADYFYSLKHTYQASLIWRQYIPLGNNKRFALFNECRSAWDVLKQNLLQTARYAAHTKQARSSRSA